MSASGIKRTKNHRVTGAASGNGRAALRSLPSVSALLARADIKELVAHHGHGPVAHAVRAAVADARAALLEHRAATVSEEQVARHLRLGTRGSLAPVLNATGIIVHTNLGRAPLARQALEAIAEIAGGYSTLEYDLDLGERGDRAAHAADLLTSLTGAEDALVVNNNAAAVLLAFSALAPGREVIVSRGELVEIGGSFRIPDVLAQSGARLVEVGTTNRTRLQDYSNAIRPETAALLKVHRSNFDMVGFTSQTSIAELGALARERDLPLVYDAGSGNLLADLLPPIEPSIAAELAAGADLIMFSGDKLLGGPQAGILVGRRRLLLPMRKHPLMRALRPDKLCLAALRATLLLLRDAPAEVPVVRMLRTAPSVLGERAERIARDIAAAGHDASVISSEARVGGGAAPSRKLESRAVRIGQHDPDDLCRALRLAEPAVIARIEDGATLLDMRSLPPEKDAVLTRTVLAALAKGAPA